MTSTLWMPSASIDHLKQRARFLQHIRQFFAEREVWEVETPIMSHATVSDVHLHTFTTDFIGPGYAKPKQMHLMTSPEFHMKRLLAAGSGSIYQLGKVFRNEESGRNHNPEFTMLEWYRVGFGHFALMDEVAELVGSILPITGVQHYSYQTIFERLVGFCPLVAPLEQLQAAACDIGFDDESADRDTLLQLLFSHIVEPQIGQEQPVFVYDFPASQAALAKLNPKDSRVAERFELYYQGLELANGFHELDNAQEQRARFLADNQHRQTLGLPESELDEHLLAALEVGLPPCAGVALGVDRLLMLALKLKSIDQVLAFSFERA